MPLVLCALIAAGTLWQLDSLISTSEWVDHTDQVIAQAHKVDSRALSLEAGLRGYLLSGMDNFLAPYRESDAAVGGDLRKLRELTEDNPEQGRRINRVDALLAEWRRFGRQVLQLRRQNRDIVSEVRSERGNEMMNAIRSEIGGIIEVEQGLRSVRSVSARRTAHGVFALTLGSWLLVGILVFRAIRYRFRLDELLAQWSRIFEFADSGIVVGRAGSQTMDLVNPGFARMHGYSVEELTGKPIESVFAPESRGDLARQIELAHEKGHHSFESMHVRKDGSVFPVLVDATAMKNDSGEVQFRAVNVRDMTEIKRAERDARSAETKYRKLLESAQDAILIIGPGGSIEFANRQMEAWFGYDQGELIGKSVELLIPERYHSVHEMARIGYLSHTTARAMARGLSLFARRKDGSELPVDISLSPSEFPGSSRPIVTAIIRDISERKRMEDEQRFLADLGRVISEFLELEVTLEKIARRCVPELADWCVVDLAGEEGHFQRSAVIHSDPSKQEMAQEFQRRYPPNPAISDGVGESLVLGRSVLMRDTDREWFESRIRDPERVRYMVELGCRSYMIVPLHARGRVLGSITFVASNHNYDERDMAFAEEIGRRAAIYADNASLYQEARKAVRTREETVAVVSHDLKNPLTAILLSSRILKKFVAAPPSNEAAKVNQRKAIDIIDQSAWQANRLIHDLLDLAKIESGTFALKKSMHDASFMIDSVLEMFEPMAAEKAIHLKRDDRAVGQCNLVCDRERVIQVLSNLVGNAIKFSPRGGDVRVSIDRCGPEVRLAVRDSGPGIPSEVQGKIFERYWQADGGHEVGSGLGLSIARGIVDAHGGRIWVESTVGKGCTFAFTLPAPAAATHAEAA